MDWTIFATLSGFAVAIIGANYKFTRDVREELKIDISKFEARMEKSDERWYDLLKTFHTLDKEIDRLKNK